MLRPKAVPRRAAMARLITSAGAPALEGAIMNDHGLGGKRLARQHRYRLIFPSQSRTVENMLSMGFVQVSVFLNRAGILSRWSVRISSKASRRESAADSLIPLSHFSNSRSIRLASS